ncbi:MAG: DUF1549 and DUF1553 domain-containing protein [Kiritimatiellaeota bacterium]|nr:DUF1549 and DUF1553 domain-containing protein [Kiritimatiellota bacterium]
MKRQAAATIGLCAAALYGSIAGPGFAAEAAPRPLFDNFQPANRIDELVLARLKEQGVPPSELCDDAVFVRRVFLDALGTLPTPAEVRGFLADHSPDKRARLIDRLLARSEFAEYWGLKWGDLLRVKAEFPSNLWPNAVQAYDRWIRDSLRSNKPYDRFARELLTATGSNFRDPPSNFYRAFQERTPRQIAENVALVFMGLRLADSGLTEDQLLGFSAFFAKVGYKNTDEWKEEIVFFKPDGQVLNPITKQPVAPTPLGGPPLLLPLERDPRVAFADWLTAPGNSWFARSMANRIWFWLLGRGIVHEPDDMRTSNPPWSPALLTYLAQELADHHYDLQHIYRLILNSRTYQLSSRPNRWNAADAQGFSHYRLRRLDAEPLLDAINQITGTGEKYSSMIPEPFTFLPNDQRAIALADGSIELPFLELFGRPPRNTSFESERNAAPSVFQAQHLLNASHIQKKIEQSPVLRQLATGQAKLGAAGQRPRWGKGQGKAQGQGKGKKGQAEVVGGLRQPFELTESEERPNMPTGKLPRLQLAQHLQLERLTIPYDRSHGHLPFVFASVNLQPDGTEEKKQKKKEEE